MCNFRVGQKVVCVDASGSPNLKGGSVYTVSALDLSPGISLFDGAVAQVGVLLIEAKPTFAKSFDARRFRPVVERKTDISIFKDMLNTTPEPAGAA